MLADLPLILSCWFLLLLWQLVGFPLLWQFYGQKLFDSGWAFGRLVVWLAVSVVIWFLAHLGLPVNQPIFIYVIFFLLFIYAVNFYRHQYQKVKIFAKEKWQLILTQEILFLIFFLFLSYVRGFNPRIEGLEKFMDVGFMATYLRSPTLPATDMWLAGESINYYTFGHFMGAIVTQFWGLSVDYSYNLILGLLMGLTASQAFSVVTNLVQTTTRLSKLKMRQLIKAGLIGSLLIVLGGNGHTAWYWLNNFNFEGYWYPDATRFIEYTIHEFPSYSFIVSDLHAHVWAIPLVLLILINILIWLQLLIKLRKRSKKLFKLADILQVIKQPTKIKQSYFFWAGLVGFQLGLMLSTNAWDFMIYGLLLGIIGILILLKDETQIFPLIYSAMAVGLAAVIGASPWILSFDSISEGIGIAEESSPLWQLLVLWLPHLYISSIALLMAVKRLIEVKVLRKIKPQILLITAMIILAWILLFLPELIFVKDIYPNHPRANTMFKLTYQAFILMSFVAAWLSVSWKQFKLRQYTTAGLKIIIFIFVVSMLIYPYFGYKSFYGGLKNYKGLDGLSWLQEQEPSDYQAILWLRQNIYGQPVVLEAVGDSYTTFARVSSFTGLPTVLGWRVHQWLWRGGFDIPRQRTTEVQTIYEQPQSELAKQLLDQYQVEYVFVGDRESEAYQNLNLTGVFKLGDLVFQQGSTHIVKLN